MEPMTYKEIATALKISVAQVKSIEERALNKLRRRGVLEILREEVAAEHPNHYELLEQMAMM